MVLSDKILRRTKKTKQEAKKVEMMNPNDLWFTTPTVSNELPQTTPKTRDTEPDILIYEDDHRQNEFLNLSFLPQIEVEPNDIKDIWINHSKKSEESTLLKT